MILIFGVFDVSALITKQIRKKVNVASKTLLAPLKHHVKNIHYSVLFSEKDFSVEGSSSGLGER